MIVAALVWAWFFQAIPLIARKAGERYREPLVAIYSRKFKALQWIALPVLLYAGAYFHLRGSYQDYLPPLARSIACAGVSQATGNFLRRCGPGRRVPPMRYSRQPPPAGSVRSLGRWKRCPRTSMTRRWPPWHPYDS